MEISDYVKASGVFLKAEDIKKNPNAVFVITGEAELVKSDKFNTERLHIAGEWMKEERIFDCSRTNARTIAKVFGEDTKKWIGKTLILETYKTKTSDGKLVDAINVKEARL